MGLFSEKFTEDVAAREFREAHDKGYQEGLNSTIPSNYRRSWGVMMNATPWMHVLFETRQRGFDLGQKARKAEILRVCEAEAEKEKSDD